MKAIRNREYSFHMREKKLTKHQYFLSKQKTAEHQIFLPVPSLNTLGKEMLHAGEKYLLREYHRSAASYGQVSGRCTAGLGSLAVALGLSMHKTLLLLQSFMGVQAICKSSLYTLHKIRVQQNCAVSSLLLDITSTVQDLFKARFSSNSPYGVHNSSNMQLKCSELTDKVLSLCLGAYIDWQAESG